MKYSSIVQVFHIVEYIEIKSLFKMILFLQEETANNNST